MGFCSFLGYSCWAYAYIRMDGGCIWEKADIYIRIIPFYYWDSSSTICNKFVVINLLQTYPSAWSSNDLELQGHDERRKEVEVQGEPQPAGVKTRGDTTSVGRSRCV